MDIHEKLAQSENLMKEMSQTWEEKLVKTGMKLYLFLLAGISLNYSTFWEGTLLHSLWRLSIDIYFTLYNFMYEIIKFSERIQNERQQALEKMGISVQASGIKVEKNKYYLVNLNADPSLNELLVYYLKVQLHFFKYLITH